MEGCIWTKTELTPLEENVSGRPLWGCYSPEGLQLGLITHTHTCSLPMGHLSSGMMGFHYWPGLQCRCQCLSPCFLDFFVGRLSLGQTPQVCAVALLPAMPPLAPDRTPCTDLSLVLVGSVDGPLLAAHGPPCAVLWDCSESVLSFFFFFPLIWFWRPWGTMASNCNSPCWCFTKMKTCSLGPKANCPLLFLRNSSCCCCCL